MVAHVPLGFVSFKDQPRDIFSCDPEFLGQLMAAAPSLLATTAMSQKSFSFKIGNDVISFFFVIYLMYEGD